MYMKQHKIKENTCQKIENVYSFDTMSELFIYCHNDIQTLQRP